MILPDIDQPVTDEVLVNSSVLPQECRQLPDESQKAILTMLARIEKMNQTGAWFRPRTEEEINALVPKIRPIVQAIFAEDCLGAFHGTQDSWQKALNKETKALQFPRTVAWWKIYNLAYLKAKNGANLAGKNAFGAASWPIVETAARTAGLATACLARADPSIKEKVNSPSLTLTLYEMGAAGVYFLPVRHRLTEKSPDFFLPSAEMLRIHLPAIIHHPVPDVDYVYLACLVFGPNEEGDARVNYLHPVVTNRRGCPQTRLLDPKQPILVQ